MPKIDIKEYDKYSSDNSKSYSKRDRHSKKKIVKKLKNK